MDDALGEDDLNQTKGSVHELYDGGMVVGLPTEHASGFAMFSVLAGLGLHWITGVLLFTISMTSLYIIHQDDPRALSVWLKRMRMRWQAWRIGRKAVVVVIQK